jgi:hypothetical protein
MCQMGKRLGWYCQFHLRNYPGARAYMMWIGLCWWKNLPRKVFDLQSLNHPHSVLYRRPNTRFDPNLVGTYPVNKQSAVPFLNWELCNLDLPFGRLLMT